MVVGLGICQLQVTLLIGRDNRRLRMDGTEDFRLRLGIDAVGEAGETFVQSLPEGDALGHGRLMRHRTKTGDVLVLDLAARPAGGTKIGERFRTRR